jgi:hypothetical protein
MVPPSQSVLRTSTRRKVRGVGVMSMSSKSFITSSALMIGGVEQTAGNKAHHSCGLVSGSVMIVWVEIGLNGNLSIEEYLFEFGRGCDHGSKAALPRGDY